MISLKQVQTEIAELLSKNRGAMKPGEINRMKARISLLKVCGSYLETSPTEEFVLCERRRIERLINSKSEQFDKWRANNPQLADLTLKEKKKEFEKEYNFKKLRGQLRALNLLLSNRSKSDGALVD